MLGDWMRPVWQTLWNYQPTLLGLRFIVSFLVLLVPTTAMGLTLPVIVQDPALRQANFGRLIGFLYGSNTLGAVAGALLGEAYLIGAFGLRGTGLAAGLAGCLAGGIALLGARYSGDISLQSKFPRRWDASDLPLSRLLLVSFGTVRLLLCLEVAWFRVL